MIKFSTILTAFLLLTSFQLVSQDNRTLETKIVDVLNELPANNQTHLNKLMIDLHETGEAGVSLLLNGLSEANYGSEVKYRLAIGAYSNFLSKTTTEDRNKFSTIFANKALSTDDMDADFLLDRLRYFSTNEAIGILSPHVTDGKKCHRIISIFKSLNNSAGLDAIKMAYKSGNSPCEEELLKTLSEAGEVSSLLSQINEEGKKPAVLNAIANSGDVSRYKTLYKIVKEEKFGNNTNKSASNALINFATNIKNKNPKLAGKIVKKVYKKTTNPTIKMAALNALTKIMSSDAVPFLINSLNGNDDNVALFALSQLKKYPFATDVAELSQIFPSKSPLVQTAIISTLGAQQNISGLQLVKSVLVGGSNDLIKESAVKSLVEISGEEAIPVLLSALNKTSDPGEILPIKKGLLRLIDSDNIGHITRALPKNKGIGKASLIDILSIRKTESQFDNILELLDDNDPVVRNSAYMSLPNVTPPANSVKLIPLISKVQFDSELNSIKKALVIGSKDDDVKSKILEGVSGLMSGSKSNKAINVLSSIGGPEALNLVINKFSESSGKDKSNAFVALANWNDDLVLPKLYELSKDTDSDFQEKSLNSFIRVVNQSKSPGTQKLLHLKNVWKYTNDDQKKNILTSISSIKTWPALQFAASQMKNKSLAEDASRALISIALPSQKNTDGMYGSEIKKLLKEAGSNLTDAEAIYTNASVDTYISRMPDEEMFVSMFDGKTLNGWKGLLGNPISRAEMHPDTLALKQAESNAKMKINWAVENGAIVYKGTGYDNLCSEKDYRDFEMWVDWKIGKKGDSGIYLRGTPQVQIWDTSRVKAGAQVGSGGLYNNKNNQRIPLKVADNPIGEWNTFFIRMIGEEVTVYLNGELVVDKVGLENYWDRSRPIFATGALELQAHGNEAEFKNIYVRDLSGTIKMATDEEINEGFKPLFNGQNLDGWVGNKVDYFAQDGNIVIHPDNGGKGNLFTEEEYDNFTLRFEFQLTPGANNGLGVHAPLSGDVAYQGKELQILDNTADIYANLQEWQYHASMYGVMAAKRGFQKPVGDWNEQEVIINGGDIKVTLNGTVILEGNYDEESKNGTLDSKPHPGLDRKKGHIGFLGHGSVVKFRNIRLKKM
jgi:HEAT repeat protein